jgi:uncharacterized protein (TIGR03437 family)
MMKHILLGLACAMACAAQTPPTPIEVRVADETVPPGGLVQLKLMMTDPRPISTGKMSLSALDTNVFGDVVGVALFSDSGDVAGAAVVQPGGKVSAQFATDSRFTLAKTFGEDGDYPLMTVVVGTKANTAAGTQKQVTIDPGASLWAWLGQNYPSVVRPGTITFGGSLSVSNVVPGGGLLPPGSVVRLLGSGFDSNTVVQVDTVTFTYKFFNSGEIDLTLGAATDMQGKRIRVKNKDGSLVTYFSYLRATSQGNGSHDLLKATTPVFANALPGGFLPVSAVQGTYTALALQNSSQSPAIVTLDFLSATSQVLATTKVTLASGMRYVREIGEIFGVATVPAGSGVRVSGASIQMLGLIADDKALSVTPVNLSAASAPTAQLTASLQALTFNYKIGDPPPASQAIALTTTAGTIPFTVAQSPTVSWLTVTPVTGTAPTTPLSATANPSGLAAGTYTTNIQISPSSGSAITIPVTLTVTNPNTPVISALVNAANQQSGALSPGEIITLYGRFPSVPATNLALTSAGKVATSLAGVRLLFDGSPAPLTYVSATQINAVVPYEIADNANTRVEAEVAGVLSPALTQATTASSPAIFTVDSSGFGSAAALNQDFSVNTASNPAPKKSVMSLFATGEGRTSPVSVTGSVSGSDLRTPLLVVTATVGGQNADVTYAGSAPGLVAGVLQVNVRIPDTAPSGNAVPVVIVVGSTVSPSGVTIAVQ